MKKIMLCEKTLNRFHNYLVNDEKSPATIQKYDRDASAFFHFSASRYLSRELVVEYKNVLISQGYASTSINSMIASLNKLFAFLGLGELKLKNIRIQRRTYCSEEKELSKAEYMRLLNAAQSNSRLSLILQTICGTGIRVSELKYFTVEAVKKNRISVSCKSKVRVIFMPSGLKKQLLSYAYNREIKHGPIFCSRNGKPLDRSNIWLEMKKLSIKAGVKASKVFPHNLRRLFARTFYTAGKDMAALADVLGHSSIDTTRIYLMTTGYEHRRKIESLGLVLTSQMGKNKTT